jgi:hypothetical protein
LKPAGGGSPPGGDFPPAQVNRDLPSRAHRTPEGSQQKPSGPGRRGKSPPGGQPSPPQLVFNQFPAPPSSEGPSVPRFLPGGAVYTKPCCAFFTIALLRMTRRHRPTFQRHSFIRFYTAAFQIWEFAPAAKLTRSPGPCAPLRAAAHEGPDYAKSQNPNTGRIYSLTAGSSAAR